jgi:hypothetical protein
MTGIGASGYQTPTPEWSDSISGKTLVPHSNLYWEVENSNWNLRPFE